MNPNEDEKHSAASRPMTTADDIDIRLLARTIWRNRWAVALMIVFGTSAGLAVSKLSARYESHGLFLVPALDLGRFKSYYIAISNEQRLERFLELSGIDQSESAENLRRIVGEPKKLADVVRPAFALSAEDARGYGLKAESAGGLLGIELTIQRNNRSDESHIGALAGYLRHTMIQLDISEALLTNCLHFTQQATALRNQQIAADVEMKQLQSRANHLRALVVEFPQAATLGANQVVSVEGGGERYLSPASQLVAAEIAMREAKLANEARDRARIGVTLKKEYYCRGRELASKEITGPTLLERLSSVKASVLAEQDMDNDAVEFVANELTMELDDWISRYLQRSRFLVAPEGTEQLRLTPTPLVGSAIGAMLGGFSGLALALLIGWWRENSEIVLSGD